MSYEQRLWWMALGTLALTAVCIVIANLYLDAAATKHYCLNTPIDQIEWERCR